MTEERVSIVEFDWFMHHTAMTNQTPERFIDAIREHFPAALPARFGRGGERPPLGVGKTTDYRPFIDHWNENSAEGWGAWVPWTVEPRATAVPCSCRRIESPPIAAWP